MVVLGFGILDFVHLGVEVAFIFQSYCRVCAYSYFLVSLEIERKRLEFMPREKREFLSK